MASLRDFVNRAMAYCWDERHGYTMGGMGYPDFDCSGFVGRCLYEAGFNYPSYHVGTMNMKTPLQNAGFQIYYPSSLTDLNSRIQPGDIVVMNHLDWTGGHTFIYMEDVFAYTDYTAVSPHTGTVHKVKIEASSSRGNSNPGDSRRDGTGAYWEVWCHAYWELVTGYSFTDPGDEVYGAHWPGGLDGKNDLLIWKRIRDIQFKRKFIVC